MTEVQNKILAYLIDNVNTDNEITISNAELAKQCDVSIPTIQKFQKDAVNESILSFEKGKYIINENANVDYTYQISKYIKENDLNLSTNEKKVLGYITKRFNERDNEQEYGFSDLKHIADNCKISPMTVSKIVKKLVNEGLIETIKGNWKEKKATQFKVLFPTVNNNPNIENNANNTININLPDFTKCDTFNKLFDLVKLQTEFLERQNKEISDLKNSLVNYVENFRKVERVAEILLDYIDEVEHDLDNVYMINNIQRPKPQCKCSIFDIRKILDDNKQ